MILLAPWALWFFLVGGGVVALYLLKIKRRSATVPALDFWLSLAGQTRVHSLFDRLKRLLSMLLWLLIVACLVLALGNPVLSLGRIKPRAIAVIIDNTASMQATEPDRDGKTRLALAKEALREITGGRPVTDEWLVIESGREPRVVQSWTYDTKSALRAADSLQPFHGSGNLAEAVELAGQLSTGRPDPCIVVISDGAAGALSSLAAADSRLIHWPVGATRDNVGIGALSVRSHRQDGNYHALVTVVNATDQQLESQVALEVDGRSQSVELVSAAPGSTWEKAVVIDAPSGGVLRAVIDRPDALGMDNEAFAILQPIRPAVVWLVTSPESAFFFEHALAAMDPLVWAEESLTLSPQQYEQAAASLATPGSTLKRPDLVIFNGWLPPTLPASGRFVVANASPAELATTAGEPLDQPELHMVPRPHPLMQHVTLQGSRLAKAHRLSLKQAGRVLAQSPGGDPLVILFEQPQRQTLMLAFDVLDSDLPFRNAFPLLLRNTVAYMHEDAAAWMRPSFALGETVRPLRALPDGTSEVALHILRDGKPLDVRIPVQNSTFAYTDTGRAGALRLELGDEVSFAALNIADPQESRIGPVPSTEDPAGRLGLSRRLLGGMPWTMLACVAVLGVVLEWLTYHFRWTE